MHCSKCSVSELVSKVCFGSHYPDNLGSTEPKQLALIEDVLRRTENVKITDRLAVHDIERLHIYSSHSRIEQALSEAPQRNKNKVVFSATNVQIKRQSALIR